MTYIEKLWERYKINSYENGELMFENSFEQAIKEAMQDQREACVSVLAQEANLDLIDLQELVRLQEVVYNAEVESEL
jgi:hypothetical protein